MPKKLAALALLLALGALPACGSSDEATPNAPTAPASAGKQTPNDGPSSGPTAESAGRSCPGERDFGEAILDTERQAATALGMQPAGFKIELKSMMTCQDGFVVAWVHVTKTDRRTNAALVPGQYISVLRQKSVRTGVASDTEWELIRTILPEKKDRTVCEMPPPPKVLAWLQSQGACVS